MLLALRMRVWDAWVGGCAYVYVCTCDPPPPTPPTPHTTTTTRPHFKKKKKQGGYIEIRPAGVHKGAFLGRVLASMQEHGKFVDFVLVVGDDASDEYMFTAAEDYAGRCRCCECVCGCVCGCVIGCMLAVCVCLYVCACVACLCVWCGLLWWGGGHPWWGGGGGGGVASPPQPPFPYTTSLSHNTHTSHQPQRNSRGRCRPTRARWGRSPRPPGPS